MEQVVGTTPVRRGRPRAQRPSRMFAFRLGGEQAAKSVFASSLGVATGRAPDGRRIGACPTTSSAGSVSHANWKRRWPGHSETHLIWRAR